jgi:membrane-bound lytic murein transglycosylase B
MAAYGTTLSNLEQKTGVPKEILTAIWGMESAYGQSGGNFNMFEALATLAYDGPRQTYARRELLAALKMVQEDGFDPREMTSSWAGAFGYTQFVPSTFLAQAVDGDGDGKIDLWHSPADALSSAARLLNEGGWQRNAPCETEVKLPNGFDYASAEMDNEKSPAAWRKLGVKTVYGTTLSDDGGDGAIYLPAGARGPAFLVFDNFRAVLKYNNAASYALGVCYLAHRIGNGAEIAAAWPRDELPLTRDQRLQFQTDLKKLGFDPGDIDGVLGRHVRAVLRDYQKARGLVPDGFATVDLLSRLDAEVKAKGL